MKKTIFVAALALVSAGCWAQKANVNRAKNLALQEEAKYDEARALIQEALENEETKGLANTWYVAGLIGNAENDKMNMQQMLGQTVDEQRKGQAVVESYEYWLKADAIAMTPTYDKKGNAKYDTKTRKQIAQKMLGYYQQQDLIKYGILMNEKRNFDLAYDAFKKHLNIPNLEMMQDAKMQAKMPKDTVYEQYKYYAALFAIQAENHTDAIALLEELRNGNYEAMTCAQFLYQEYVNVKDTDNFVRVLKESIAKYPSEPWFLQNLINHYIFANQEKEAIDYLAKAIEQDPTVAQYYQIRGNLNENQKNYDQALADFDKALELDPKLAEAVAGKGRVYYNQAVKMNEDAAYLDGAAYKKALDDMNALFKQSMPFFEKAHEMAPENRDYMVTLRTLYYRFHMDKEYEAINDELNK